MKKILKCIMLIITLVIAGFLLLVMIGFFGGDDTKNSDNVYFYEPEKKKQYVPSDILNPGVLKVDEENIPDKEYSDTLELAMKNPDIDISPEDDYMRNMDKIIKEFKSDRYIAVYFISEKGETEMYFICFKKLRELTLERTVKICNLKKVIYDTFTRHAFHRAWSQRKKLCIS